MRRLTPLLSLVLPVAVVLAATLTTSLFLSETRANWNETLTIAGTVQTGNFSIDDLTCEKLGQEDRGLTWSKVPGADGYNIFHDGPFGDGDFELLDEVAAPATSHDGLRVSYFRHRWYVSTVYESSEGSSSDTIKARCRPAVTFPGPEVEGDNHHSQRTVEVTWKPAQDAVLYGVFRADESGGDYKLLSTTPGTTYTDTSVADGITYYYVVVALDREGNESDPSEEVAVPDTTPPSAPSDTPLPTEAQPDVLEPTPVPTVRQPDAPTPTATPTPEPCPAEGCQPAVSIGRVTIAAPGEGSVDLEALHIDAPGLGLWTIDILYDPAMVTPVACSSEHVGTCNPDFAVDTVRIIGWSGGLEGDNTLASLTFACKSEGVSALTLSLELFVDANLGEQQDIDADKASGSITCIATEAPASMLAAIQEIPRPAAPLAG